MSRKLIHRSLGMAAAGAAMLALSACGFTLGGLAGPGNVQAIDAAVACDFDRALGLAEGAKAAGGSKKLFSFYVQYAVYTETGQTTAATEALDEATRNPETNPEGATSRQGMQEAGDAILQGIRDRREEETGSPVCPS